MTFESLLFEDARTYPAWLDQTVDPALLHRAYDLAKMGPTSMNCCPLRIAFVQSADAKAKLLDCVAPGNLDKTRTAPVTAILAYDLAFYEHMQALWPLSDARARFAGNGSLIEETAFRNGTLQAAYFMLAARGVGLDCGPMSGFDRAKTDEAFFAGTTWRSNFLCNLGYGDKSKLYPRLARLSFAESTQIL